MNLLDITCKSFLSLFALMRLTQMNTTDPMSLLIFAVSSIYIESFPPLRSKQG